MIAKAAHGFVVPIIIPRAVRHRVRPDADQRPRSHLSRWTASFSADRRSCPGCVF